jgi:hypothetical protein
VVEAMRVIVSKYCFGFAIRHKFTGGKFLPVHYTGRAIIQIAVMNPHAHGEIAAVFVNAELFNYVCFTIAVSVSECHVTGFALWG